MISASINIAIAHTISKYYQKTTLKMQKTREEIDKYSQEFVTNYTSMRLYRMENTQLELCQSKFMKLKEVSYEEGYKYGFYQFIFAIFPRICEVSYILTVFYLGFRANFWECLTYYGVMSDIVNIAKDTFFSISRSKDAIRSLKKYMLMEDKIQNKIPLDIKADGVIEFRDVTFAYPTKPDQDILVNFNESIHTGDKVAFIGNSGIGKTTIIKLILGLYDTYKSGNVCYNGFSLRDYTIADSVAIVPQEPTYFSEKTIRENVLIGNALSHNTHIYTDEQIANVLRRVKLDFLVDNLDNIQANLSGGQKQRIAVARVLLTDRPIVVLDEPSSSLDKDTEKVVIAELSEYFKDKTVILITHNHSIITDEFRRVHLE
jgi:ABC-type multidrug transport system fused ATPase/permease subunit